MTKPPPPDFDTIAERISVAELAEAIGAEKTPSGWRCPLPERHSNGDRAPSFSIFRDGDRTACRCHGCDLRGSPVTVASRVWGVDAPEAARKLAARIGLQPSDNGRRIADTYDYVDEDGDLLFQVVRFRPKTFRQRRPGPDGWEWTTKGTGRVLYRLPRVRKAVEAGAPIYLVEGEKDVHAVEEAGAVATTNPGGAGKWRAEYTETLAGARVGIVADGDEAGRDHAWNVARELDGVVSSWAVLEPAVDEPGADVSDHLAAGHELADLVVVKEPPDEATGGEEGGPDPTDDSDDPDGGDSQKDRLLALTDGLDLFSSARDVAYARIRRENHLETWPVHSSRLRAWLAHRYHRKHGGAPTASTVSDVLAVLDGRARFDGPTVELANRFARHEGDLWYDFADERWRAVRVSADGWEVVGDPPPLFRRFSHQKAQVDPADTPAEELPGLLAPFLNVPADTDRRLLTVWIVTAYLPDIPRPALVPHGPQGSAKSFLTRMIRRLTDPSGTPMPRFPRGDDEMAQALDHHAVLGFDNVSSLSRRQSDTLCRAVTGDGFTKRRLYTDDEVVLYSFRRALIINGINVPAQQPDLLDRSVLIRLEHIEDEDRAEEKELWARFEAVRPRMVGAILDALARAQALEPDVELAGLPRMADWTRWGVAVAEALGIGKRAFLRAYAGNRQDQTVEALISHPVGAAVRAFMDDRDEWTGTPSALLAKLEDVAEKESLDTDAKLWPGSASWLSRRLNEVETNLRRAGIQVGEGDGEREIRLRQPRHRHGKGKNAVAPEPAQRRDKNATTPKTPSSNLSISRPSEGGDAPHPLKTPESPKTPASPEVEDGVDGETPMNTGMGNGVDGEEGSDGDDVAVWT